MYNELIGIPFKHMGRTREGLDCWGLVLEVFRMNGKTLIDPVPDYTEDWDKTREQNHFLENYHKHWEQINGIDNVQLLDVALIGEEPTFPTHIGVVIEENKVIHCGKRYGVIITRFEKMKRCFTGFYRLKNGNSKND